MQHTTIMGACRDATTGQSGLGLLRCCATCCVCIPIWIGWLVWTSRAYRQDREEALIIQRHHWSTTSVGYGLRSESGSYWAD